MDSSVGYAQVVSEGSTENDTIFSGHSVRVYGYSVVSTDAQVDFYNSYADVVDGNRIVLTHRVGDPLTVFYGAGVMFPSGIFLDSVLGTTVTLFAEKI